MVKKTAARKRGVAFLPQTAAQSTQVLYGLAGWRRAGGPEPDGVGPQAGGVVAAQMFIKRPGPQPKAELDSVPTVRLVNQLHFS
jgi:hypothetical protein